MESRACCFVLLLAIGAALVAAQTQGPRPVVDVSRAAVLLRMQCKPSTDLVPRCFHHHLGAVPCTDVCACPVHKAFPSSSRLTNNPERKPFSLHISQCSSSL